MKRHPFTRPAPVIAAIVLCLFASDVWATAQIPDRLLIDGRIEQLFSEPLNSAFQSNPGLREYFRRHSQESMCTALWRGYRATWEVRDSELYLVKVEVDACSVNPREVTLGKFFHNASRAIKAVWYTGSLTVPQGEILEYVHLGYESRYERYQFLHVENGKVVRSSHTKGVPGINPEFPRQKNHEKAP